jgi:hypothetical protein
MMQLGCTKEQVSVQSLHKRHFLVLAIASA